VDVDEINSAAQSFVANCCVEAQGQDVRLAYAEPGAVVRPSEDVWHPRLQFVNQQKICLRCPSRCRRR
jgi:hypothetical protein